MLWTAVSAAEAEGALVFRLALTSYFSLVLHPALCIRSTQWCLERHAFLGCGPKKIVGSGHGADDSGDILTPWRIGDKSLCHAA